MIAPRKVSGETEVCLSEYAVRGKKMTIKTWERWNKMWAWEAGGNGGLEADQVTALSMARRWLKDGQ